MKTTERFENAVMKLYKAFHNNELNALDCKAFAVGNICNNKDEWGKSFTLVSKAEYIDYSNDSANKLIKESGYSHIELAIVEQLFVNGYNFSKNIQVFNMPNSLDQNSKENQFKGLCAVVEYLAKLDNIPNPMDYTKLFETENDKPKYELWHN